MRDSMTLAKLSRYPLKSARGHHLVGRGESFPLSASGIEFDRLFMLVDPDKKVFLSQRTVPKMALLSCEREAGMWLFHFEGALSAGVVPTAPRGATFSATLHGNALPVTVLEKEVGNWFSKRLGTKAAVVIRGPDWDRHANPAFDPTRSPMQFQDGYPFHLITRSAVEELSKRCGFAVSENNFRANFVVSGAPPHAEDDWKRVRIGAHTFKVVKPCTRCAIPAIDQMTGKKNGAINVALAKYRRSGSHLPSFPGIDDGSILFGQNLVLEVPSDGGFVSPNEVIVGDEMEVLE